MGYEPRLHVVLYQPEIPQNTGNIGRTCVALGAKLWLVRPLGFRLDESRLRRAGLDYWEHLQLEVADDWGKLRASFHDRPVWFFSKTGCRSYISAQFQLQDILVFGNESNGLPPSVLQAEPDRVLRIPMRAEARSLNLASSVAIAAYEASRQIDAFE